MSKNVGVYLITPTFIIEPIFFFGFFNTNLLISPLSRNNKTKSTSIVTIEEMVSPIETIAAFEAASYADVSGDVIFIYNLIPSLPPLSLRTEGTNLD